MSVPAPGDPKRPSTASARWLAKARRVRALVRKEIRQILRDPSSIGIGIVLPLVLIVLFGYGQSLDVKNVPVAIVLEDTSPSANELAAGFVLSPYFSAHIVGSMQEAHALMRQRAVDGVVHIPAISRAACTAARMSHVRRCRCWFTAAMRIAPASSWDTCKAPWAPWAARKAVQGRTVAEDPVIVQSRMWFNES